jgi:hypothetical protein
VGASATYGDSAAAASALCTAIGPSASVLFVDFETAATFAPVVRGLCGQPAALMVLGGPSGASSTSSAAQLEQAVRAIDQAGRRPVLLGPSQASVSVLGLALRRVVSLQTSGDAEVLTGPPAGNWPITYTVWLGAPPGT